ncbi:ArsR/SmtB family transcription factor [Rhodococcus artemisiae]|uniref:Metalloregulator ArsR/SmtB family transcription factor n=1 Tax=Rhodococcus artemisiae TaxID=714159 RepID=A0ABU7LGM6_9NOCA|nr:metalloregulator ArsR/SmtB family transcription factor [Rhodococcus artemisiae]MEE2060711.1 metalloregulator ArsR/SmtB family transcription factor [Rhodococcus artemisiae]
MDEVFKALSDANRRRLLDRLNMRNGQSLRELREGLEMSRQAVTKHLAVLIDANLVATVRHGRERLHYLNPAPISEIADRWIGKYDRERLHALADLKRSLEDRPMSKPTFVYVTYIQTTPEKLWQALTDAAFIRRWFGGMAMESDWQVGSPIIAIDPDGTRVETGEVVLESEPGKRLAYTFKVAADAGSEYAELAEEPASRVTFELEQDGETVKLTLTHDDFIGPESKVLESVQHGWPAFMSSLKTLLETGEPLP